MQRIRPFLKPLFLAALIFAYVAAIMPSAEAPTFSLSDKVDHMITFFTLAVLAGLAWPRTRWWHVALALAAFGALIEFTQAIPALQRDASVWDWVADVIASLAGLSAAAPLRSRWRAGDVTWQAR
jgi:VanZ family protein